MKKYVYTKGSQQVTVETDGLGDINNFMVTGLIGEDYGSIVEAGFTLKTGDSVTIAEMMNIAKACKCRVDCYESNNLIVNESADFSEGYEFPAGTISGLSLGIVHDEASYNVVCPAEYVAEYPYEDGLKVGFPWVVAKFQKVMNPLSDSMEGSFPSVAQVGKEFDFSVKTIPGENEGDMVLVRGTVNNSQNVSLKYLDTSDEQYKEFPIEEDGTFIFGPKPDGFPLSEAESKFKATMSVAGDYNIKVEVYRVSDNLVLSEIAYTLTVKDEEVESTPEAVESNSEMEIRMFADEMPLTISNAEHLGTLSDDKKVLTTDKLTSYIMFEVVKDLGILEPKKVTWFRIEIKFCGRIYSARLFVTPNIM